MSKYWILDREDTPQGLPLSLLVARLREITCGEGCRFLIRRSQGYGAQVGRWDEMLDQADEVAVSTEELERIGTDEWFYNLDAMCVTPSVTIAFGLHDSSALYLDAPSDLAERITANFKKVQVDDQGEQSSATGALPKGSR